MSARAWGGGSIGFRLLATTSVLVLAIVGFQGIYFPARQIDELTRALERKALALTRLMAYVAAPSLEFDDKEGAVEVFRGAAQDADFLGAVLLAEDGKQAIASVGGDRAGAPRDLTFPAEPVLRRDGDVLRVVAPVVAKAGSKAILVASFSTRSIEEESRAVRATTFAIGLLVLALALALAWWASRSVSRRLQILVDAAEKVSRGDLSRAQLPGESEDDIGRMTASFNRMLDSQRQLVRRIAETAVQLSSAASQFAANATQQERGATEQSTAVGETRRTMQTLLDSAKEIAKTAQSVLQNAERTQANSQIVAERIAALSAHTERIAEILEVIKDIANKSDILALNAALEGTKAGEAGKGFSLVASQMQRLAENVMGAVKDIKELTTTITSATQSSVLATEESTKLAGDTTRSARQIALIIQQQQTGTEQVTTAMEVVADIATQAASGSKEIVVSATDLRQLTERLQALVGRFQLDATSPGAADDRAA